MDPERMQLPRRESKIGTLAKNSRQPSPVDAPTPIGSEARKHGSLVGRKRKHGSVEVSLVVGATSSRGSFCSKRWPP